MMKVFFFFGEKPNVIWISTLTKTFYTLRQDLMGWAVFLSVLYFNHFSNVCVHKNNTEADCLDNNNSSNFVFRNSWDKKLFLQVLFHFCKNSSLCFQQEFGIEQMERTSISNFMKTARGFYSQTLLFQEVHTDMLIFFWEQKAISQRID